MAEENKALTRYKKLALAVRTLEGQLKALDEKGVSPKEKKFLKQKFYQNWYKSRDKETVALFNEIKKGFLLTKVDGDIPGISKDPKKLTIGETARSLDARNPATVLKFFQKELALTEKYLGAKYKKDRPKLIGIKGRWYKGLEGLGIGRNDINDDYIREFDKDVFYAEREEAIKAQNTFKSRNKSTWHENYDDANKGWRSLLPISHSQHPKSVNKAPYNPNLGINPPIASEKDNVTNVDTTAETTNQTLSRQNESLGIKTTYGGGGWVGRNTDVRMSDGSSTVLSIHKGKPWRGLREGDSRGVMTRNQAKRYDEEMRKRLTVSDD